MPSATQRDLPPQYKILIDTPASKPALGYVEYATALADVINESIPQFAVGVFGGWGSGKTTLMQEVRRHIDFDKAICVEFSAWRYEKEEHLIVPLLSAIRDAVAEWAKSQSSRSIKKSAAQAVRTMGSVITSLVAGLSVKFGIPEAFQVSFDASKAIAEARAEDAKEEQREGPRYTSVYYECFKALKGEFQKLLETKSGRRMVVFVDDLDRCLPRGVLQVLESMKLFFDLHGFVFVVGLDQRVAEWCVDTAYARENREVDERSSYQVRGSEYIKKIFQVPFSLLPVAAGQVDDFLEALISQNSLCREQADDIRTLVRPHLEFLVGDSGVNPREVKRFINAFTLSTMMKPALDPAAVLALRTISFRPDWQPVLEALLSYGEVFLDALDRQVQGQGDALARLHSDLQAIPEQFLIYASPGAPGASLLGARPLDEYIRSGAAISSSGNPKLLDLIQQLGGTRRMVESASTEAALSEVTQRVSGLLQETESVFASGKLDSSPYGHAAKRATDEMRAHLDLWRGDFADPNRLARWRESFDSLLSRAISALAQLYNAGERS